MHDNFKPSRMVLFYSTLHFDAFKFENDASTLKFSTHQIIDTEFAGAFIKFK